MGVGIDVARQHGHTCMDTSRDTFIKEDLIECERNVLAPSPYDIIEQLFLNKILIGGSKTAARLLKSVALHITRQGLGGIGILFGTVIRGTLVVLVRESQPVDGTWRICIVTPDCPASKGHAPFLGRG